MELNLAPINNQFHEVQTVYFLRYQSQSVKQVSNNICMTLIRLVPYTLRREFY